MTTHTKSRYAIRYGKLVQFFIRPPLQGRKYRQPILDHAARFRNKAEALMAMQQWENA